MTPAETMRNAIAAQLMRQQQAKPQYGYGPYAKGMQGIGEGLAERFAPAPQQPQDAAAVGPPLSLAPPPVQPAEEWMPPLSWGN